MRVKLDVQKTNQVEGRMPTASTTYFSYDISYYNSRQLLKGLSNKLKHKADEENFESNNNQAWQNRKLRRTTYVLV